MKALRRSPFPSRLRDLMPSPSAHDALYNALRFHGPRTAVVLGSGFGAITERVRAIHSVDFTEFPDLAPSTIAGHAGRVILGEWSGTAVLLFSGRLHFYEGHSWERVLAPVRLMASWKIRRLLLTNAAGGIREDLQPGTLMIIQAHLNWTRSYPACLADTRADPYSPGLIQYLDQAAAELGWRLPHGTYAAMLGPNYETPAEIRALRALGADAVGMSTARDVEAAAGLGLECAAVSCITNRAAGLSPTRLTHEEVLENSRRQASRLGDLIEHFLMIDSR